MEGYDVVTPKSKLSSKPPLFVRSISSFPSTTSLHEVEKNPTGGTVTGDDSGEGPRGGEGLRQGGLSLGVGGKEDPGRRKRTDPEDWSETRRHEVRRPGRSGGGANRYRGVGSVGIRPMGHSTEVPGKGLDDPCIV